MTTTATPPFVELVERLAAKSVLRGRGHFAFVLVGAGSQGAKFIMLREGESFPPAETITSVRGADWYVVGRMVDGLVRTHTVERSGARRDYRWEGATEAELKPVTVEVNEGIPNVWATS